MMLMAEWNRLRLAHSRVGDIGRALEFPENPPQSGNHHGNDYQRSAGNVIAAAWKNLHVDRVFRWWDRTRRPGSRFSMIDVTLTRDNEH